MNQIIIPLAIAAVLIFGGYLYEWYRSHRYICVHRLAAHLLSTYRKLKRLGKAKV